MKVDAILLSIVSLLSMKKFKFAVGSTAILCMALAIYFVLKSDYALLTHPKGIMARRELELIRTNLLLMLLVVGPALLLFYGIAWKHRAQNSKAKYDPEHTQGKWKDIVLWCIPLIAIIPMAIITIYETHRLDPYRPIESDKKPLEIQVVAIDWKWLFIYPEEQIATVNFLQIPEQTPIHFHLAADGSPMNSFWIPQLSGQIYAMAGMSTTLHLMADEPGEYTGRAAEINGDGFADMTFLVKSTTQSEFDEWVKTVQGSSEPLTEEVYAELLKPSMKVPIILYSHVENGFYHKILMKYMMH